MVNVASFTQCKKKKKKSCKNKITEQCVNHSWLIIFRNIGWEGDKYSPTGQRKDLNCGFWLFKKRITIFRNDNTVKYQMGQYEYQKYKEILRFEITSQF